MIKVKGDFVASVSMEGLYGTSSTDLDMLSDSDQKKIETMVKGSFVQSVLNFEKALEIDMKNLGKNHIDISIDYNHLSNVYYL